MEAAKIQAQIRQNSMGISDYLSDLTKWETSIQKKDKSLLKKKQKLQIQNVVKVRGITTHPINGSHTKVSAVAMTNNVNEKKSDQKLDAHTYDKGYKKWESFDVDSALKEVDEDKITEDTAKTDMKSDASNSVPLPMSPADFMIPKLTQLESSNTKRIESKGTIINLKPRDEIERESGNDYFKKGEFYEATKCYTRSIGINLKNHISYSNRAMAYLKLKEYDKAEADATDALKLVPDHVKSYQRRGTARNSLGKHKSALNDFESALKLSPKTKVIAVEIRKTRELIKAAVRKTPRDSIPISIVGEDIAGPKLPSSRQKSFTSIKNNNNNIINPSGNNYTAAVATAVATAVYDGKDKEPAVSTTGLGNESSFVAAGVLQSKQQGVNITSSDQGLAALRDAKESNMRERALKAVNHIKKTKQSKLPPLPKNSYEFTKSFNSLKSISSKMEWLSKLDLKKINSIFKSSLEPEMFMKLLSVIRDGYIVTGEIYFPVSLLAAITNLNRFSMLIMLLDKKDISMLIDVFDKLENAACTTSSSGGGGNSNNGEGGISSTTTSISALEIKQLRSIYMK